MDELELETSELGYLYRYYAVHYSLGVDQWDDPLPGYRLSIQLEKFAILKRTPKGAWIRFDRFSMDPADDKKFVLLTANKRYACPDLDSAMESFIARKKRQILILKARLQSTQAALNLAESLEKGKEDYSETLLVMPYDIIKID